VAQGDLELEQLDVKTSFLHSEIEKMIYRKQPKRYFHEGQENKTCLLKMSFCGLKQAPDSGISGSTHL